MLSGKVFHNGIILLEETKFTYIVMNMWLLQCKSMISCVILSFYTHTCYPFSYLTVIFTRKDFIQLNHISSYPRKWAGSPRSATLELEVIYLVIYLVWPHQSWRSTCVAVGLCGFQSSKKPIRDCLSRCRPFLKAFTVPAFNVRWSRLFQVARWESAVSLPIWLYVWSACIHDLWDAWWKITRT